MALTPPQPRYSTVVDNPAQANLVYCPHPILATRDRTTVYTPFLPGESIARYLNRIGLTLSEPVVLYLNGREIPRAVWDTTFPATGDLITVRARVQGGGSDSDKVLRTVLQIAVLVAALTFGAPLGGALNLGLGDAVAAAVGTALIQIGGTMLVNALVPPPSPEIKNATGLEDGSPTYALTGGTNRARPYAPLPLVIGTHRIFPDLGARPYTEFLGSDQFLYQVFNFGLSDMTLSDFRIGNTRLASDASTVDGAFSDVQIEESGPDGALTIFPANVDTIAGGALTASAGWITRTSSPNATALAVDITGLLFFAANKGLEPLSVTFEIEYASAGSGLWQPWFDTTNSITITNGDRKPLRYSYRRDVPSGQYDVRVRRVTPDATSPKETSDFTWQQLRSYQADTGDYTGQKRVALKIKATSQLSGQVDSLSALATARCEAWTGTAWVLQATSNPAWWFRWLALGKFDANGQRLFGAGLPTTRIDEQAIKDWGAWCDMKGLSCNLVFDRPMNVDEMLIAIARCGRATPTWASGKLGVVWDEDNRPAVAVFCMSNIVRDSFRIEYATGKIADEIVARFINPALDWQPDTVRAAVPGVTNPVNPVTVDLWGVTDKDQAGKEALLLAAAQTYRRRRIIWETDMEGLVVDRGDVVTLSHDLTQWGYSGRLVSGTTTTLQLDRQVPFTSGEQHYIGIRFPDGSYGVYDVNYQTGPSDTLSLSTPLPSAPDDDPNHPPLDYLWFFEPAPTPGKKVKIVDIQPLSEHRVRITAVDEDPNYYAAENNPFSYTQPTTYGNQFPTVTDVQVGDTLIRIGAGFGTRVAVTWDVTGEYGGAWVRYRFTDRPWVMLGSTTARAIEFDVDAAGTIEIEISAFNKRGRMGGSSTQLVSYTIVGQAAVPEDVTNFTATLQANGILLAWDDVQDIDLRDYELRLGADYDSGQVIDRTKSNTYLYRILAAGSYTFGIKARDTTDHVSATATYVTLTINAPGAPVVSNSFEGPNAVIEWTASTGDFPIVEYEIRYGSNFATAIYVGRIKGTRFATEAAWSGTRRYWVAAIDAAGNMGAAGSIDVVVSPPGRPSVSQQVIDNNVLLSWSASAGTLPIDHYEVRKGADFATAEVVGEHAGTFAPLFEIESGIYTYWVVAVDSAGNYGTEASIAAAVNEPPDYILKQKWLSTWSGTKTNALVKADGHLLVPVVTSDTYQQHFTNNGWNSPQDQINAGFPYFMQPSQTTAVYEETFDYGTVLAGTLINVVLSSVTVSGNVTINPIISVRKLATDPWTDYTGVWQVFATDFQYVKVRLEFSAAGGDDLLELTGLEVRLDVKRKYDGGMGTANAADTNGTVVNFNRQFIDVDSITVTPQGSGSVIAVYDFTDTPYPTSFSVYLYNSTTGARVSGPFSWSAEGF